MKRNVELLTKVRDLAVHEPAKFDMNTWVTIKRELINFPEDTSKIKVECGTTACIAGWAVQLAGDKLLVDRYSSIRDGIYQTTNSVAKNGRVCDIQSRAQNLLGLTEMETDILFFSGNDDAIGYLNDLIAGNDITEDYEYEDDDDWDLDDDDDD